MNGIPETKRCPRCEREQPSSLFYVKDATKGLLMAWCKPCYAEVGRERYQYAKRGEKRPRKPRPAPPTERQCVDCGRVRAASDFRPQRRRCKDCDRARAQAEHEANPDKRAEVQSRFRERHREELKAAAKRRYASGDPRYGPEKHRRWRTTSPDVYRAATRRNKAAHPERVAIDNSARRARILGAEGSYTALEWEAIKQRYDYTCLLCKRREPEIKLSVDHVIPLVLGGRNDASNLQPLCRRCNSLKHATVLDLRKEWS